jgi:hypothetical protein
MALRSVVESDTPISAARKTLSSEIRVSLLGAVPGLCTPAYRGRWRARRGCAAEAERK